MSALAEGLERLRRRFDGWIDMFSALAGLLPRGTTARADVLEIVALLHRARGALGREPTAAAAAADFDPLPARERLTVQTASVRQLALEVLGQQGAAEWAYALGDGLVANP